MLFFSQGDALESIYSMHVFDVPSVFMFGYLNYINSFWDEIQIRSPLHLRCLHGFDLGIRSLEAKYE